MPQEPLTSIQIAVLKALKPAHHALGPMDLLISTRNYNRPPCSAAHIQEAANNLTEMGFVEREEEHGRPAWTITDVGCVKLDTLVASKLG